ncbi:hypothetical protein MBAV_004337, partial [Candidatus Magnetobacterium bavaricum]
MMLANMMGSPAKSETSNNALNSESALVVNYASLMGMGSAMTQSTTTKPIGQTDVSGNPSADNLQTANKPNETSMIQLDISSLLRLGACVNSLQPNVQVNGLQPNVQVNGLQPNATSTEGDEQTSAAATTNDTANILKQQIAALVSKSGQAQKEPSATPESSTSASTTTASPFCLFLPSLGKPSPL